MSKNEEILKLLKEGKSYRYITNKLGCSNTTIKEVKNESLDDFSTSLENTVMSEIQKLNLNEFELKNLLKQINKPEVIKKSFDHFYDTKRVKIGIISDTHIGSKYFNQELFMNSIKTFNREGVDAIYHSGDLIEGMSNREGHIYELETIGVTNQIKKAVELLNLYKQPLFFITGNHDEWASKKSDQGVIVGEYINTLLPNAEFLGEYNADVKLAPNVTMRLTHEGSSAYALSYSMQKRINGISGGDKPEILVNGHIHKALYMFYRNIHGVEAATFQEQTPFMRMKGSPAMTGYYVFDIGLNKRGVNEFNFKFYPGY
jgi:predicted phosphodiesterase